MLKKRGRQEKETIILPIVINSTVDQNINVNLKGERIFLIFQIKSRRVRNSSSIIIQFKCRSLLHTPRQQRLTQFYRTRERLCMNQVTSLLSMSCLLLRYSFTVTAVHLVQSRVHFLLAQELKYRPCSHGVLHT